MNIQGVTDLLKAKIGSGNVWTDFVPEKKPLPALAFTHLANGGGRVLKGSRFGTWDTWRVMIVGKTRSECNALLVILRTLDNTSDTAFKNIFVLSEGQITEQNGDKTRTNFIDIKTYNNG